ncbi:MULTISPECIES: Uma2 family endonuclease [unclassified Microcystis]|jgi:Uma2 family endonuclease|uniref:Uma2 family endonuclease n=1 Tax=Microcystis flos-aquae Mf_QC_C_20070823_S10D TaxID=2486236 RepID=A0A552L125_9CHRO|nr:MULTISPECIES: Uma2 family endonuclease [unclassified Microcystis]MCA2815402.1 Uma2 family endonuclease [Microcystis sp. M085S1]TRT76611.1 MAG: Uma2 family endonuclease [Microcystis flos-aquae Ma_QC_C_20070823_S18]TRT93644.1 MAG: Uma2 family endonuclease [Microcystis flos-aquae Ma_QC_C_20070823_S18D]TRV13907.1 MAG: Uma2 family endonuclease [Microcystis flos-aquae Mf_QC_C_20070823_S10D]TRV24362.1 MAG: Uma2 family endonuclease [Microcystis flos-aquae Mf_QC_C_20070823_S10]TRV29461.1 MAG: Uma2 
MVTVPLELNTEQIRGEKRVVFNHLSWLSYQQILQAVGENNRAHLFYDRGTLEITMTLEEHEFYRELIGLFIRILVVELGLKIKSMGSTTLAREDLERGAEPDNAYYIQNQAKVLGKRINLTEDPPPDLVVEVDITHTDINKLELYARLGVPELWRFNGEIWRIYRLEKGVYQEEEFSPTFPLVPKTKLYEFLATAKEDEVKAEKNLRAWVVSQLAKNN